MSDHTGIEWTDATWNPIAGCSVVSPGCTNCYAMRMAGTRLAHTEMYRGLTRESKAGPVWTGEVRVIDAALERPLAWRKPRRIFVNSMGDLFHESIPFEVIDRVFDVMERAHWHTFQVLTKRARRMYEYMRARRYSKPKTAAPPNVWLGVSAEDQPRWDERVSLLRLTPACRRFVSVEPMLGGIECGWELLRRLDWIICGGESGRDARPMHPAWARALRDQCDVANVRFFLKQWGEWISGDDAHARNIVPIEQGHPWGICQPSMARVGKKFAGRELDGRTHDEFPR